MQGRLRQIATILNWQLNLWPLPGILLHNNGIGMTLQKRNNVHMAGGGSETLILSHGFGCDQSMWKFLLPHFIKRFRVITYDLVGAGQSDVGSYDQDKYASLWGYAADLNELIAEYAEGPVILAGHSVGAMIGVLVDLQHPGRIAAHAMIGASPCYIDSAPYIGGFSPDEIHSLLATLDDNYLGWSSTMAPVLMGAPGQPALGKELVNSFRRTDAQIARQFARIIFLSDHRQDIAGLQTPALIVQCCDDPVVPVAVGEYLHRVLPNSQLSVIDNIGHYPQLSAPSACSAVMDAFFAQRESGHG